MLLQKRTRYKVWLWLVGLILGFQFAQAQRITVTGVVSDSTTGTPLSNVSVYFKNGGGVRTDAQGAYFLQTEQSPVYIEFSIIGYKKLRIPIKQDTGMLVISVKLHATYSELSNVTVTKKNKQRYRNKDNPAVELIRQVINHKDSNRVESFNSSTFERYEKMQVSLSNLSEKLKKNRFTKKFGFVFDNADTTKIEGKSILPVYLEETISRNYLQKKPERSKTVIVAQKKVDFGEFIDSRGVSAYLNRLYEDVDIYSSNLSLLTNQFLSPIADIAPTFYMYFIKDTLEVNGEKLIRLYFSPRNPNDLLLRGTLYITLDGHYAIQKLNILVSKYANINFVRELKIAQDFEKGSNGRYHVSKSDMIADFGLSKNGGGFVGERTVSYKDFQTDVPIDDSVFEGPRTVILEGALNKQADYWDKNRHDSLTSSESKVYANIDSLKKMPSFKRTLDIATLLLAGYKTFGPVEVGPVNTFYSFNPVEGFRLRLGGRTTPKLSNRFYTETYAAYGFKDEKWKYFLSGTYSINNKTIYDFPLHYLRASFQRDTKIPGQELQFVQEDNLLLSFKRGDNNKWLYNDIFRLDYVRELNNHLSYTLGTKYWKQSPAGKEFVYQKDVNGSAYNLPAITTGELSVEFRYAPHEQFYQGKLYRIPIFNKYPIFKLRYIAGVKGLFGGEYNYQSINANIYKRFYLSQLGYTDVSLEGGYLAGKVPFPLMDIHRANQTYSYQLQSYNLMNFLEFVSDHYVALNVDHYFNGFIFNKIPLIKKAKLREVVTAKVLYGGIRDENNPAKTPDQVKFPVTNGVTSTFSLSREPYIECSVGIANILKIFRVDVVKRFTYLDHPNVPQWGIRGRFKFDF
ncbi:MAG: carboxypeptidase-like regulatory domain-containing protein [Bacteroidota bacterium]|nr:carboxypeptidase-like regulatory domain-containing protein [Bacteroidota bacterium]